MVTVLPPLAEAQATIKSPSTYNQQEREAVEVVRGRLNAWTAYDLTKLNSCMAVGGHDQAQRLDEWQRGRCTGRTGTVAAFFRVENGRITEWLDPPVTAPMQAAR